MELYFHSNTRKSLEQLFETVIGKKLGDLMHRFDVVDRQISNLENISKNIVL